MQPDNSRNTIIFVVATLLIFAVYTMFVLQPQQKQKAAEAAAAAAAAHAHPLPGTPAAAVAEGPKILSRAAAEANSPRVQILTPTLHGSIALHGARIDDLYLSGTDPKQAYRVDVPKNSPPVELFTPVDARNAYFASFDWFGADGNTAPGGDAIWTLKSGTVLSPGHDVVLGFDAPGGVSFSRTVSVDKEYMFTVTDTVTNNSAAAVVLTPSGSVKRQGLPTDIAKNAINVHQGAVGYLDDDTKMFAYKDWAKKSADDLTAKPTKGFKGGWIGITDKYWMAALVPDQRQSVTGFFVASTNHGVDVYDATFKGDPIRIDPGHTTAPLSTRLFAGAKRPDVINQYQNKDHKFSKTIPPIKNFDLSIDWGKRLWPLTRPIFFVLDFFFKHIGNFGVAILLLTVTVKVLFFPLANQAFASMSKMKKVQPQVAELKVKYKDDQAKQQQEMMALYAREKINPLAGCFPILIQIPVFFGLLKTLEVVLDMRQAPFLWLQDLSARDPSTIWNLFGLIPWDPATAPTFFGMFSIGGILDGPLHLGFVGLLYGGAMYLQQSMSPTSADPTQQQIMKFMPLVFMFILARYPVGLMIYWTWSTLLTIIQQYFIMHRYKADNPIDDFIARFRSKPDASSVASG
jgi:YidC/Oxa1 family membrane protein insertase